MKTLKRYVSAIMVAGLLFTTVGCVNDNESASVTELRGAKADQMKAEATLARAQADAAKISADAEAALNKALAAYHQAQADQVSAQTDIQKNEATERLKGIKSDMERTVAENQAALDRLKIETEMAIIDLQAQLKIAQSKADADVAAQLTTLIWQYSGAITTLNGYKSELAQTAITKSELLLALELAKTDSAAYVRSTEISLNNRIASNTATIKSYENSVIEWSKFTQSTDVAAKIAAKENEAKKLQANIPTLYAAKVAAYEKYSAAEKNYTDFTKVSGANQTWYHQSIYTDYSWSGSSTYTDIGGVSFTYSGGTGTVDYVGYSDALGRSIFCSVEWGYYYTWSIYIYDQSFDKNFSSKEDCEHQIQLLEQNANVSKANLNALSTTLSESIGSLAVLGKTERTANATYLAAKSAYDAALKVYLNANATDKPAKLVLLDDASVKLYGWKYDGTVLVSAGGAHQAWEKAVKVYDDANLKIKTLTIDFMSTQNSFNMYTAQLETARKNLAILSKGSRDVLYAAMEDARIASDKASLAYSSNLTDVNTLISDINALNKLQGMITNSDNSTTGIVEYTKQYVDGRITYYNGQITNLNDAVAKDKARLKVLGTESGATQMMLDARKQITDLENKIIDLGNKIAEQTNVVNLLKKSIGSLTPAE